MKKILEDILHSSRWVLSIFYFGLYIGLLCYGLVFLKQTYHLITEVKELDAEVIMLGVLELVDMAMVGNLCKMIITGSYNSFISKSHGWDNENVSSGILKVKMTTSLIGISSMYLLKTFLSILVSHIDFVDLWKQLVIHGAFMVSAVILSLIEFIHIKGEYWEVQTEILRENNCKHKEK